MPGPGFTQLFGGSNVYPAQPSFLALNPMIVNQVLAWPIEQTFATPNVASIIEVNATLPGLSISFTDATQTTTGYTTVFNNIGAQSFAVKDFSGNTLMTVPSGQVWQIYLADNSTQNGIWRVFQYGAGVSNANAAALAGAGLQAVLTLLQETILVVPRGISYVIVNADRANAQQWTGGVGTFTLPDPTTLPNGWFTYIKNSGTGNMVLQLPGGNPATIDGQTSLTFAPTDSAIVFTDGVLYYTIGLTHAAIASGFNFISINIGGTGDFVLSGAQLNQVGYRLTGVLTGNRRVVVPGTTQEYWIDNQTTGAFQVTVATAAQVTPISVPQGVQVILFCDGSNVLNANSSSSISFPIAISNGGTGAVNAAAARTNLGATALGALLFTEPSVTQAQTDLSVPPNSRTIGGNLGITGGGDLSANRTLSIAFNGANVHASNVASLCVAGGGFVIVPWPGTIIANYNPSGWWSAGSPTRLTVPAGVGVARLTSLLQAQQAGAANFALQILKNGATVVAESDINMPAGAWNQFVYLDTGPIQVVPGDYFEVRGNVSSGANVQIPFRSSSDNYTAQALG